jgi:polyferredoxin
MKFSVLVRWFWVLIISLNAHVALGVERFPPPEFEPGYQIPIPTTPAPRVQLLEWLDVAVLFVALSLSTYFVLKKRSRKWILGLGLLSLLYFGFYRKGCVCAIGSIQDVTLGVFDSGYKLPVAIAAFFLLPIVFALFFGRSFCGSVCPQGAIQDLVLLKPIHLWPWLERTLRVIPSIYLGAAIVFAATGSAFIICEWDPFIALFRRSGSTGMLALGALFLVVGAFIGRPYCRFFCPYGVILGWASRFSKWRVTLSPNDCIQCALCDTACPYGAIDQPAHPEANPSARKRRLAIALILLPVLVSLGYWIGSQLTVPFSKVHPTVRLAERVAAEDAKKVTGTTEESDAFRATGKPVKELNAQALKIRDQFSIGTPLFGAFLGLVFAARLLSLALASPNKIYEPHQGNCVSCGRCYKFCPREMARVRKLTQRPPNAPAKTPATPSPTASKTA